MFSSIGRFCVRRRRFVLAGALLLFVAGIVVGSGVFMHLKESNGSSATESVQGASLLDAASGHGPGMVAVVDGLRVGGPSVRTAVLRAAAPVADVDGVTGVVTSAARGWTTSPTLPGWTATNAARPWSPPGSGRPPSTP